MKESTYNRVQRFLNKEMEKDELKIFDNDLQTDEALAELLAQEIAIRKIAKAERLKEISAMRKTLKQPKSKIVNGNFLFKIVGAIVLLGGLLWLITSTNDSEIEIKKIIAKASNDLKVANGNTAEFYLMEESYELAIEGFEEKLAKKESQGFDSCEYLSLIHI